MVLHEDLFFVFFLDDDDYQMGCQREVPGIPLNGGNMDIKLIGPD